VTRKRDADAASPNDGAEQRENSADDDELQPARRAESGPRRLAAIAARLAICHRGQRLTAMAMHANSSSSAGYVKASRRRA